MMSSPPPTRTQAQDPGQLPLHTRHSHGQFTSQYCFTRRYSRETPSTGPSPSAAAGASAATAVAAPAPSRCMPNCHAQPSTSDGNLTLDDVLPAVCRSSLLMRTASASWRSAVLSMPFSTLRSRALSMFTAISPVHCPFSMNLEAACSQLPCDCKHLIYLAALIATLPKPVCVCVCAEVCGCTSFTFELPHQAEPPTSAW